MLHLRCGWKVGGWRGLAGEGAQRPIQALQTAEEDRILGSEKAKWVALGVPADDTKALLSEGMYRRMLQFLRVQSGAVTPVSDPLQRLQGMAIPGKLGTWLLFVRSFQHTRGYKALLMVAITALVLMKVGACDPCRIMHAEGSG